jgi:cell cycle arrest protein BUB2
MHSASSKKDLINQYEDLLNIHNPSDKDLRESLKKLRRLVLTEGIPTDPSEASRGLNVCSLRGKIWKVLLGAYKLSADEYVSLLDRGPCQVYDKIKNDTFRTLATDRKFQGRVNEGMLARVLNAFVWKAQDQPPSRLINLKFSYVQGMNVLLAPFLYVMPELDAFQAFSNFIQHTLPLYVQPALEGVHCGIKLFEKCLKLADPSLHKHLKDKGMDPVTYAFPCKYPYQMQIVPYCSNVAAYKLIS